MPRRLPTFFPLTLAATVGLFALTSVLTAQPPTPPPSPPTSGTDDDPGAKIRATQEANLKQYRQFADALLRLAQKWEKGSTEEQDRAKTIRAALAVAEREGVDRLFKDVVSGLGKEKNPTTGAFEKLIRDDAKLTAALKEILVTLEAESDSAKRQREIATLEAQLKEAKQILRDQENLRARTENPKGDPNKLSKDQGDLANRTKDLADQVAGKDPKKDPSKSGDSGDPKDNKSEPKTQAKPGENPAENKPDTQESKSNGKDPMAGGEPKDSASAKPNPMGGDPMAGSSKDTPKDGAADPMAGGAKSMGEPKDNPMGMNPTGMNPMNPMGMNPSNPMASKPQGDSKSQSDGKGMSKPSDGAQGGESKPMNSPPSDSQGSPKGSPSPSSPSSPSPSNPNSPKNQDSPAQKNLDEAVPSQKGAEQDLKKPDREEASKKEDKALDSIRKAIDELEKKLKQLREKEMAKKLQDLEQRVRTMLQMQKEVLAATEALDAKIRRNSDKPLDLDRRQSQEQADKEALIVAEADKALEILKGEGTAVVFAGVLVECRRDMEAIREQLQNTQVGEDTQLVEQQVIAQLERMLEALKKAQQDMQPPPPPMDGMPPPPQDPGKQSLIKLVEQLKLLRSLQQQVNERTTVFGKKTPGAQATDQFVQNQLKLLGERQRVLQEMLQKIAAGD